jgi:putative transcriptional regulator
MENHRPGMPIVKTPEKGSIDVRAIRLKAQGAIGATEESFAQGIGISVRTLRNWEQGRREPSGPARVLLSMIQRDSLARVRCSE